MAFDLKQYWQELAKKAGIPDNLSQTVLETLGNETVAKAFSDGFVPRPDYSRDLDKVRDETKAATAGEWKQWYEQEVRPKFDQNFQLAQEAERYRAQYGALGAGSDPAADPTPNPNGSFLTREEAQRMMHEHGQAFVGLTKVVNRISTDFYKKFGEPLNLDEVEKIARDRNIPADVAYEQYIAPRVREQQDKEFEVKLKTAREEGAREALSRARVPIDSAPREGHLLFDQTPIPKDDGQSPQGRALSAFSDAWNEATTKQ